MGVCRRASLHTRLLRSANIAPFVHSCQACWPSCRCRFARGRPIPDRWHDVAVFCMLKSGSPLHTRLEKHAHSVESRPSHRLQCRGGCNLRLVCAAFQASVGSSQHSVRSAWPTAHFMCYNSVLVARCNGADSIAAVASAVDIAVVAAEDARLKRSTTWQQGSMFETPPWHVSVMCRGGGRAGGWIGGGGMSGWGLQEVGRHEGTSSLTWSCPSCVRHRRCYHCCRLLVAM